MTNVELWQACLGELELSLSKANFTTWFKNTSISFYNDSSVIINVPNAFTKAWLEKKYHQAILKSIQNIVKEKIKEIIYKVDAKSATLSLKNEKNENLQEKKIINNLILKEEKEIKEKNPIVSPNSGLNPKYKFENFIIGKGYELAYAASQAIIAKPGKTYNPLLIYGGAGLGKTHLLHAIGNHFLLNSPSTKVLYATLEKFMSDFIYAIRYKKNTEFKDLYRNIDVLLIDDLNFISGKEGIQEEFFHTFNALHQQDKQIVLSSDRPPKAILSLDNRLLSRFAGGIITEITPPDLETRIAILEAKCKEKNYFLDERVIHFIASSISSNVRELEGVLNKIIALHQIQNSPPTFATVKNIISGLQPQIRKKFLTPKQIVETVASYYDLNMNDLVGPSREKCFALPRQIAMYLMREEIKSSFPAIGKELGNRDHTTAMHACSKISKIIENDLKLKQEIESILQQLSSS